MDTKLILLALSLFTGTINVASKTRKLKLQLSSLILLISIRTLSQRTSIHCEDFVQLTGPRFPDRPFAEIIRVFTHCFPRDTERRIFLIVRRLRGNKDNIDPLLNLPILESESQEETVAIVETSSNKVWMVPFDNENGDAGFLHCVWDVQFS